MPYRELPDEIAAIHDRPEDFPELTAADLRKLDAYLKTKKASDKFQTAGAAFFIFACLRG